MAAAARAPGFGAVAGEKMDELVGFFNKDIPYLTIFVIS
jgi:hypothetical protein